MMLKRKDVVQVTGLCYSTVYNLEKVGKFPARKQLSPGRVAWVSQEVRDWLANARNAADVFAALSLSYILHPVIGI